MYEYCSAFRGRSLKYIERVKAEAVSIKSKILLLIQEACVLTTVCIRVTNPRTKF